MTIQDTNHSPHWLLNFQANIIRNTANQSPTTANPTIRPSAWPLELTTALANDILHAPGSPIAPASKRATRPAIRWPRGRAQKGCTATESTTTAPTARSPRPSGGRHAPPPPTASGVARWAGAGRRPRWPCSSQPRRGVTCGCWGAMGAIGKPYGGSWAALIAGSGCMSVEMAVG